MLSMCSLVCRLVRGWKQSEATTLISQAATTPGSSLLLHDLSEPDLNLQVGSYIASPYPQIDVLLDPYKYTGASGSQTRIHSAFCQALICPEGPGGGQRPAGSSRCGEHPSSRYTASLFCRRGCGEDGLEGGGGCELLHPPPRTQIIWCDNNRQASLVTPRQSVDLSRWTLFFSCEDDPVGRTIQVPDISTTSSSAPNQHPSPSTPQLTITKPTSSTATKTVDTAAQTCHDGDSNAAVASTSQTSLVSITENYSGQEASLLGEAAQPKQAAPTSQLETAVVVTENHLTLSANTTAEVSAQNFLPISASTTDAVSVSITDETTSIADPITGVNAAVPAKLKAGLDLGEGLKTPSVSHGFGVRARSNSTSSSSSSRGSCDAAATKHNNRTASESYEGVVDVGDKITILLEARYNACGGKNREDDWRTPVMADQVCEAYAWKCRGVFGVIAHATPQQLMTMVEAFFANNLMLDNDLYVTKILTVDCVGEPGRMTEPSTIAESVTPGGYYTSSNAAASNMGRPHQHTTLLDAARRLSASAASGASLSTTSGTPGDSLASNLNAIVA